VAVELATGYVSIIPSAKGFKERLGKELDIDQPAERAGQSAGNRITSALGRAIKGTIVGVGVAAGAALSTALVRGWGRLTAIEEAQSKLQGLGHSAKSVQTIMDNALASVRGTAFGLDEAATVAASAVAAGIKPGIDLERVLKTVADTSSIAGVSMAEMGAIFNKVAASNRLTMGEVNQLADRGVPILQMLADQYGVNAEEMSKMVSQGKVSFAEFSQALQENIGGAALESGNTTRGAFANMMAAAGRFGAVLLEGVFPVAKQVFGGMIVLIDRATDAVRPWAEQFSTFILDRVVPAAQQLMGDIRELAGRLQEFVQSAQFQGIKTETMERLGSIFGTIRDAAQDLGPSVLAIAKSIGQATASIGISTWQVLLSVVDSLARVAAAVLVPAIQKLADWMERNQQAVTILVGAYTAWKLSSIAIVAVTKAQAIAMGTMVAIQRGAAIASNAWAVAQWALNAAMSANPIGLIVVAIAALVAGLVLAYKKSETFRNIVHGALNAVGAAATWLWENAIKPAWDGIVAAFQFVAGIISWWWNNVTKPVFDTASRIFKSFAALGMWLFNQILQPAIKAAQIYIKALGTVASWLWNNAVKPAFERIGAIATWLWNKAIKPAFDNITKGAKWLWENGIKPAFDGIRSTIQTAWSRVIKPTFDKVMNIVGRVRDTFRRAFSAIGGFIRNAFDTAVDTVKGAINSLIRLVNRATGLINDNVISKLNKIPNVDFPRIPSIPELAQGGIVPATPGGRVVRVAEAGEAEAIIPLSKLDGVVGGASAGPDVLVLDIDLGEGIKRRVEVSLREHDRQVARRVRAGTGAVR
jgi:tape measure domain-containing protein